ncbi:uncharacterized protein T551_00457 [Pneumocystis jirovecii RU7]|uniref:Spindle pole body component n=1 Tax=Pneumocystis jirovecii (strain RU7) TaxID=1408657 RepID=A0A0W4ZVG3_PNEJ7|nr:uncharacterized protein T551_00457 [Pneumocystis jirovecii RU7]KTW32367.1 hypothetical protein T551_00457 [Pneumocystis jirovecii RU7]
MKIRQEILELLEGLIANITGIKNENNMFYDLRDKIVKMIKESSFMMVNQFEIKRSCYGLVEKFDILSKENHSTMLENLFDELFKDENNGLIIDMLALILNLSDNPLEKKLEIYQEQAEKHVEILPVNEIDDFHYTGEHWKMIDSLNEQDDDNDENDDNNSENDENCDNGDDIVSESFTREKRDTKDIVKVLPVEFFPINMQELDSIEKVQYWRSISCQNDVKRIVYQLNYNSDVSTLLTETNVVREIIFMIQGNETVLFLKNGDDIKINENFFISQISHTMFLSFLEWFLERGRLVNKIRSFISNPFKNYLENVFVCSVEDLLGSLDSTLAYYQSFSGDSEHIRILTILSLQNILDRILDPYIVLSDIISKIDSTTFKTNICNFLNMLFDKAKFYYSIFDKQTFLLITILRSALLEAYLRPLELWFSCGELPDIQGFFITKSTLKSDDLLLLSEYQLSLNNDGTLLIPDVLKRISQKSLLIGKLKKLLASIFSESKITFFDTNKSIFQKLKSDYDARLVLFSAKMHDIFHLNSSSSKTSEILNESFEHDYLTYIFNWVDQNYYTSMKNVLHGLFYNAEIEKHLNAIFEIYCLYNSNYIINFINSVFEKMDHQKIWCDKYILQDLIQISMKNSTIDLDLITIKIQNFENDNISNFYIYYKLPLSLTSIISSSSRTKSSMERNSILIYRNLSQIKLYFNWLINILISYFFDIIIKTHVETLQKSIKNAINLNEIINIHNSFINSILTHCFLNLRFKQIHDSIMEIFMYVKSVSELIISFQKKEIKTPLYLYLTSDEDMSSDLEIDVNRKESDKQLKNEETFLKDLIDIQKKTCSVLKFILSELQELPQEFTTVYIEILMENLEYGVLDIES